MIPLTDNEKEPKKKCYICQIEFCYDKNEKKKFKLYKKVRDHCHYARKFRGAAHSICNLRYKVPQEISVKIHNGPKYDYHFIIRELAEEFKGQFECLGENTEKYITFSVPIKKEHDSDKTITYKIKFIDTCRFMQSKLSDLVDSLSEKFPSVYQFCNGDLNKFVLLLRKGVYPYEYMDSWERFNETSLPPKKDFYSELNLEDISDKDYEHPKKCLENIAQTWVNIMICMFTLIHFCLQIFLKNLETNALKHTDLILLISYLHPNWHGKRV